MNKKLYWLIPALFLALGGLTWLAAGQVHRRSLETVMPPAAMQTGTPTIGTVAATPNLITVNTSTPVTITAHITDSRVTPTGVNLLRLNATGTPPTVLGVMRDDGTNGDVVANDKTFSLRVNFNEPTAGQIQLQVSAAFRGVLRRVVSSAIILLAQTNQARLGPSGGTYTFPNGALLTVPAGALSIDALFDVQLPTRSDLSTSIPQQYPIYATVRLIPSLVLPTDPPPATATYTVFLSVPLFTPTDPGRIFAVLQYDAVTANWRQIGVIATVDASGQRASFKTADIGVFILVNPADRGLENVQ